MPRPSKHREPLAAEPVAYATWGRWCGAGPLTRSVGPVAPHCSCCDRRVVGIDGDGYAFSLLMGPYLSSWGRWSKGFHLGLPVVSRAGKHVRFKL